MDSLVFLCARRVVTQGPFPALPKDLYPILFKAAFLDGRPLVLRDFVASWPFPELNFQRLVGHRELLQEHDCQLCEAIIQGVVSQLQRELEEPSRNFSLRMLDMTGLSDSVTSHTEIFASACVEASMNQQEFQRDRPEQHEGGSGAGTSVVSPQPPGVDIHTDLFVSEMSYDILCDALQTGAASPLRLKCREFTAMNICVAEIVTLLESLDPSFLRSVVLFYNSLELTGLSVILPYLSRFPELRSLKVQCNDVDVRHLTPKSGMTIRNVARQLGMLPSLRELSLEYSQLSGNLCQILCDLQTPLESLELGYCSLLPADLAFLSQSCHAPALKRLDLSGHDISQGLLEPLRLLLEETSSSLLHLDLMDCHVADSHLDALLPMLLRCSRLRVLNLHGNSLSTAAIKDLLQRTLELPDLHLVVYPYPEDCYKPGPPNSGWDFVKDEELFAAAKAEFSQILENSGRTNLIWTDSLDGHEAPDFL
ncbi:PREDICTED: leucine-rich repeat-containing protein 14-like [Ficedula albicollis]|uniref:Leucine-rich repeat-containing protein 14 n=1 Tax=Ficedula albicollis TaxID=59894 RepID=U3KG44_FICAL|nr:PREDICTED: leucine-rich repeat-containing protein 14-like [Ficedula albicollis]XP_005062444.1 PREDICTED: leucine-rich repeat-containing protein 14-like [Ficedula albicollis]